MVGAVVIVAGMIGVGSFLLSGSGCRHRGGDFFSFVYVGCNRVDRHHEALYASTANVPQLEQTLSDISGLSHQPGLFVFTGDLVLNLKGDRGATLKKQLNRWASLYFDSPLGRMKNTIPFVPITGNHESDVYSGTYDYEYPDAANANVWLEWMERNGFDRFAGNGPDEAWMKRDALAENNNQKLTYSFNLRGVHFIVLNTDTVTTVRSDEHPALSTNGWIAYHWIQNDLKSAEADDSISRIVVLGHKPLKSQNSNTNIINTKRHPFSDRLIQLFADSSKFVGYFCAHSHEWNYQFLRPAKGSGKVLQVVAGNGGSQLNGNWQPDGGRYFGFTEVKLYGDGTTGIISYRRPVPDPYYDSSAKIKAASPSEEILIPAHHKN